jgi:hypothetical protein
MRRQAKVSAMAGLIPDDLDTLLTRVDCAEALTAAGFPTSPKTLATKASRGGGPPFRRWGWKPLYPWGSALSWAMERLGPPMRSTSEADAWKRAWSQGDVPSTNRALPNYNPRE